MFGRNDGAGFFDSAVFMDRGESSKKQPRMKVGAQKGKKEAVICELPLLN